MLTFTLRSLAQVAIGFAYKLRPGSPLAARFRLYPIDLDVYGHMNNACYLRVAELSRWRQIAQSGILTACLKRRWMFVVAEQSIVYHRQILPFQQYVVRSEVSYEGKWIYYDHYFESCDAKTEKAMLYAHNKVRAVAKQFNGKTVMPEQIIEACPGVQVWLEDDKICPAVVAKAKSQ